MYVTTLLYFHVFFLCVQLYIFMYVHLASRTDT